METKTGRIADISAREVRPIFTSLYHLLNEKMLLSCHRELSGNKAVGFDEVKAGLLEKGEYKASDEGSA